MPILSSWQGNPSRDVSNPEVREAIKSEAGKESHAISAFSRFQELFDLTIKYGRQNESVTSRGAMWKELCRFRELYCKAFEDRDLSELAAFNRYLDQFVSMR